jgi:uncharacterized protein (TIGR03435 family)
MIRTLILMAAAALACAAADVTGSWAGSYYAGPIYVVLKQEGAKLTGTAGPSAQQQMLKLEGRVEGDLVTFKSGPIEATLRLEGDDLKGDFKDPSDTAPLTLTRAEVLARRPPPLAGPAKPFDVATVKVNKTGGINGVSGRGGQIRPSKGQIAMENVSLWKAICFAYGIGEDKDYAITTPGWMKTERYDIVGKIPPGTTWEQMLRMLQGTLAERLKVTVHRETKDLPVYALVVAKDGPKLQAAEMMHGGFRLGPGSIQAEAAPLAAFADRLSQMVDRPVIDQTGLVGAFKLSLEWTPDQPAASSPEEPARTAGVSVFTAIQQQLGLRLEARKSAVPILVVDSGERVPTEN